MKIIFFESQKEFREWLEANHDQEPELWIGFYNKQSGKGGLTYREALDEALCYGWIDGVRKKVDEDSYTNRFTPRRARSNWSLVNIKRVEELKTLGKVRTPGMLAFEARQTGRAAPYSYELRNTAALGAAERKQFRANAKAWKFFSSQPPGYRRLASFYVMSGKKEETRARRLARLIDDSAKGRRLGLLGGKSSQ